MRTTVNLADDVVRAARSLAREQGRSLGDVLSDLARRGLEPPAELRYEGDFPVFLVREGAGPLTPEMVARAAEEP
ncbi:MAG: hypothetical protein Q8N53_05430 [Longimicrobiales bacterium]|nr:hypothetical protein [Longimicrobiales bacterium]